MKAGRSGVAVGYGRRQASCPRRPAAGHGFRCATGFGFELDSFCIYIIFFHHIIRVKSGNLVGRCKLMSGRDLREILIGTRVAIRKLFWSLREFVPHG